MPTTERYTHHTGQDGAKILNKTSECLATCDPGGLQDPPSHRGSVDPLLSPLLSPHTNRNSLMQHLK